MFENKCVLLFDPGIKKNVVLSCGFDLLHSK